MKRKGLGKLLSFLLLVVFATGLLAGCKKDATSGQVLRFNLGAEPATADPALNNAVDGANVILNTFEGLTTTDQNEIVQKGMADSWEVSADGLVYTFHLKKDVKWSDGKPVVAGDFEYAWKRALNPDLAAEYAYQMYYLKNGEAYNTKAATADTVGVKALDDSTLEVTLEYPTPYFLNLCAFPTYMPVRKDIVEGNESWFLKGDTYICNGAFKLKEWQPKSQIVLEKNPNYYNAANVKLDRIEMKMITEASSALSAFKAGQLDYIEAPPAQEIPKLLQEGTAQSFPYLGTYFYVINISDKAKAIDADAAKALSDVRVRKALNLAINKKDIVEKVTQGGQIPATTFVPPAIPVDEKGTDFKNKDFYAAEGDFAEAKKLLAEAGYPNGQGFPTLTLTYNTGSGHQNVAVAVQAMWKTNLGINVELQNQEWKVFQKTRTDKDYLIARHGWIGDYVDPMTFLDMWVSNSGQNDAGFASAQFDKLILDAKKESDKAKRIEMLRQAEEILMNEAPIVPIYYYKNIACIKPYVKDAFKSQLGFVYFQKAYIQK